MRFLTSEEPLKTQTPCRPNLKPESRKQEDESTVQLAHILYDSALISAGFDIDDQAGFNKRMLKMVNPTPEPLNSKTESEN